MQYTLRLVALVVCFGQMALAQNAPGPATPMPPAPLRPGHEPPRQPGVPTLWLVGDSTVRVNTPGEQGWGDQLIPMFDPAKIRVINRAIGGRSSRSFITEGRWDAVLKDAEKGDYVIIQLGHNDGGPLAGDNRERGSIRGVGDDTQDVTLTLDPNKGKKETVHTYGWYIRKYVTDAKAHGLTPIVCSWIPHCPKAGEKYDPNPAPASYRLFAQQAAEQSGALYIDLYELIWTTYAGKTPEELKKTYFTDADWTHTSPAGAKHNAQCVAEGIKSLPGLPLAGFLKPMAATPGPTTMPE